jgi:Domain of unknown function (DU1801).
VAEIKTKPTEVSPAAFIDKVENEQRRKDGHELSALMKKVTGKPAKMWGPTIVGFDQYHYKYASGHEGDMPITGFSPRKQSLVLYLGPGLEDKKLLSKLGKHKLGKGCLYINKLDDVNRDLLSELVTKSVEKMRKLYPSS